MDNIFFVIAVCYLIFINIITIAVYGVDKRKAKNKKHRISENTLIILAVMGGALGALTAMKIFHHKTKKPKFYIGIPLILVLNILIAGVMIYITNVDVPPASVGGGFHTSAGGGFKSPTDARRS